MIFWEHITNTRKLSWVDRKFHLKRLQNLISDFESLKIRKIYLLGYAEENPSTLAEIIAYVQANKPWALKHTFNSLPYGEDELGLTVIGNMFSVYLLVNKAEEKLLCVLDGTGGNVVYRQIASRFSYQFLCGKRIVYPPLSLLPGSN